MIDFEFYNPTKIIFGRDALSHLLQEVPQYGRRVLLVYGGGSIKRMGLYDRVMCILNSIDVQVWELGGVRPNPRLGLVRQGVEMCRAHDIELVLAVGGIAPVLRFVLFGMPPLMPKGIAMSFELAAYGLVCGILYIMLPRKKSSIYASLVGAMLAGRIVWGVVRLILAGVMHSQFLWGAFISGAFVNAVPGIIVQLILIPVLVIALEKYTEKNNRNS